MASRALRQPRALLTLLLFFFFSPITLSGKEIRLSFEPCPAGLPQDECGYVKPLENGLHGWIRGHEFLTDRAFTGYFRFHHDNLDKPELLFSYDCLLEGSGTPDILYLDLNFDQRIGEDESFALNRAGSRFMAEKVPFTRKLDRDDITYYVNIFLRPAVKKESCSMTVESWGRYRGKVELFGIEYELILKDGNCNGSFADFGGRYHRSGADLLSLTPVGEEGADTAGFGEACEKQIHPKMFFGNRAYSVDVKNNGRKLSIRPFKTSFGKVALHAEAMEVTLRRDDWGGFALASGKELLLPVGTYSIDRFSRKRGSSRAWCSYSGSEKMTVHVRSGTTANVKPETSLFASINTSNKGDSIRLSLKLETQEGARLSSFGGHEKDNRTSGGIPFVVRDKSGEVVYEDFFRFGCCGTSTCYWDVEKVGRGTYTVHIDTDPDLLDIENRETRITVR